MNISVVIPCHNAGRWIGQALRSVAAQTCPPVEIILVDDDSSDDSVEQIKASGVALRVLPAQVQNAAAARNLGIAAAAGDWIALLDADDVWYPNHLERAAILLENSDDVALIGNNDFIDAQGRTLPRPPGFTCSITNPTGHLPAPRFVELLADGFHFGHSTVVYRRSRLLECGLFDPQQRRRHDIDLFLRVIHNHTWAYDSVPSIKYRIDTPGSISQDLVKCEYYWLRALLKNSADYPSPSMDQLINTAARRGMGLAFVDGSAADLTQIKPLAWPRLRPAFRLFYRCAAFCPPVFRSFLRWRRRIQWGHLKNSTPQPLEVAKAANA